MEKVTIEDIIAKVKEYNPASDSEKIRAAYELANEAHAGQKRDSGEPYIYHPLQVAWILAGMEIDDTTIIAGLLHDVVEMCIRDRYNAFSVTQINKNQSAMVAPAHYPAA